jgi:hypothetical protein
MQVKTMSKSGFFWGFATGGMTIAVSAFVFQLLSGDQFNYSSAQRCLAMFRVQNLVENGQNTPPIQGDASSGLLDVKRACEGRIEKMGLLRSGISIGFIVAFDCANGKKVAVKYWDRGNEYGEMMITEPREATDVIKPFTQACRPVGAE